MTARRALWIPVILIALVLTASWGVQVITDAINMILQLIWWLSTPIAAALGGQ